MEFITLNNGEQLAYMRVGSGEKKLLAIHGNYGSSIDFRRLINNPPANCEVIIPDLRGFGDSSYNTRITCLKDFAEDLVDLCDKLGIASDLYVLGWSLGGGVAMEMAILAPTLVKKLFLMNSTSCYGYPLYKQDSKGAYVAFSSPEDLGTNPFIAALQYAQKSGKDQVYRDMVHLKFYDDEEKEEFLSTFLKQRNLLDADWALAVFNITDKPNVYGEGTGTLYDIKCPVVLTTGDADIMVPYALVKQNIEAFMDRAKLIVYKNCGHSPIIEKTEEVLRDIAEFLED